MDIITYSTKWDKINLVATFLMSGPSCGWLFLIGPGGDGKSMATNEAVKLWRRSLGEDVDDPCATSDIIELPCHRDGTEHKIVLMKKDSTIVKTIVHINAWSPAWEFMATEWHATVARFERGNEV
jgi:hypothetical protein